MNHFTESVVEDAALAWLESLGYAVLHGPDIAVGEPAAERSDPNYREMGLEGRLRQGGSPCILHAVQIVLIGAVWRWSIATGSDLFSSDRGI